MLIHSVSNAFVCHKSLQKQLRVSLLLMSAAFVRWLAPHELWLYLFVLLSSNYVLYSDVYLFRRYHFPPPKRLFNLSETFVWQWCLPLFCLVFENFQFLPHSFCRLLLRLGLTFGCFIPWVYKSNWGDSCILALLGCITQPILIFSGGLDHTESVAMLKTSDV